MAEGSPRVMLADEQPTVRASVKRILESDGFEVCGEADDAAAAVDTALREGPDVCIIGIGLEGGSVEAITRIHDELPRTAIIVLTRSHSRDNLVEAVRAGASGYLLQEMDPERLPAAVRGVLDGEAAIPRSLVTRLLKEVQSLAEGRTLVGEGGPVQLTPREWEILDLMSSRLSTAEIAEQLFISPVTVRRHVSEILHKLEVSDRDAAIELFDDQA